MFKIPMLKTIPLTTMIFCSSLHGGEYEDWLKSQNNQYNQYKKSIDQEFSQMLQNEWKNFKTQNSPKSFKQPKPKTIPIVKSNPKTTKKNIDSKKIKPIKIIKKKIDKPKIEPIKKLSTKYKDISFIFYGQNIDISYDKKFDFQLYKIDKKAISDIWQHLSKVDFKSIDKQIKHYSDIFDFNDWAKYKFIYTIGLNIYNDKNKANIFTWYIFTKMNYDIKIGYKTDKTYLLARVKEDLYQVSFFNLKDKKYYILTPSGKIASIGSIYTYPSNYPNANKILSFNLNNKRIKLYTNIVSKNLTFDYQNKNYSFNVKYSKDLIEFYKTFPQSQYQLYFNSKKSLPINNTLLIELKDTIENMTEIAAVNFLLRFTQKSFKYKTDYDQFRYEKVLFPEETVYYPYSDCEDRTIMFSYLVKSLLNLDLVGLKYSDHLSAAVHFSTNINGDHILFNGKKYIITDPTYINANAGISMPKYKNSRFEIIR